MKIQIIYLFLLLLFPDINAQSNNDNIEHKCSHASINSILFKGDYISSPLLSGYDVKFYKLDINLERDTVYISGNVQINAEVKSSSLDTFAFDLINELIVDSVLFENVLNIFLHTDNIVLVPLLNILNYEDKFSAIVYYHGSPPTGTYYSGLNTAVSSSWGKAVTWTFSEPFNARQWWPCKQDLKDKADSAYIFITTSEENMAGSNGILTSTVPLANNKQRFEWKTNYPIDYYLISAAVSEYQDYKIYAKPSMCNDSILIQNFIYDAPGCLTFYKNEIDITADLIELFSELYGLYPFHKEKYGHCLANMSGGMEHQTMTSMGNFNFELTAHELSHQWFGNNVTCASWSDIWINEGFASYSEYLAYQYIHGQEKADNWMKNKRTAVLSEPGGSVYIPPDQISTSNPERIFDGRLSYRKGAILLHMIRFELQDDDLFFEVMKEYQKEFKDSVATGMDFKSVLENVSGRNFTDFFDQWYFGEGYPIYTIKWKQNADALYFSSTQITSTDTTTLFKMLVEYQIKYTDGSDTMIRVRQSSNFDEYFIPLQKRIEELILDPNLNVLASGTVSKIIEDDDLSFFTISPNPCQDFINIEFSVLNGNSNKIINVLNAMGQKVCEFESSDRSIQLNTSFLESGLYFLQVQADEKTMISKFVRR